MKKIKITVFADPVCTWCWGSVPILRAIEFRYPEMVDISYVMGGMIDDITKYSNRRLGIGGDIEMSNRNMLKAWGEASAHHGMPVCDTERLHLFSEEHRSTIPQNLAYIVATVYNHKFGETSATACPKRYLRRLQEATAVDAARTGDFDTLADLAAVEGYEPGKFKQLLESREVHRIFEEDKETCRRYDVQTFPTFLLEYKGTETMLRGYTTFNAFADNIKQLTYGKIHPADEPRFQPTTENVLAFVEHYGSVYPVEIATAFSLQRTGGQSAVNIESYALLPDITEELVQAGKIMLKPRGNGFIVYPKNHKVHSSLSLD